MSAPSLPPEIFAQSPDDPGSQSVQMSLSPPPPSEPLSRLTRQCQLSVVEEDTIHGAASSSSPSAVSEKGSVTEGFSSTAPPGQLPSQDENSCPIITPTIPIHVDVPSDDPPAPSSPAAPPQSTDVTPDIPVSTPSVDVSNSSPAAESSGNAPVKNCPTAPCTPKRVKTTLVATPSSSKTPRSSKRVLTRLSPTKAASKGKKKAGNPGNFHGKPLEFLHEELKIYRGLKPRSKARSQFYINNFVKFKEKFPDYKLPSRKSPPPLEELTPEQRGSMSEKEIKEWEKSYKRKLESRERNDDECLRDALKTWFQWQGGDVRAKDRISVGRFLQQVKVNDRAPKKKHISQVVMSHPDFKDQVKDLSKETGRDDRLLKRTEAATTFLKTLTEDQRKVLEENINKEYQEAKVLWSARKEGSDSEKYRHAQEMYRKSLGRIVQPFLDGLRETTGLDVGLLIGEDVDGQGNWDGAIAQAKGAPKLVDFDPEKVDTNFINYFYRWLQHLRSLSPSKEGGQSAEGQDSNATSSAAGPSVEEASTIPVAEKQKSGKKPRKGKGKALSHEGSDTDLGKESVSGESDWSTDDEDDEEAGQDKDDEGEEMVLENEGLHDSGSEGEGGLTYEQEQARNIRRNKAWLKDLGLDRPLFDKKQPRQKRTKKARIDETVTAGPPRQSARNKTDVETSKQTEALQNQADEDSISNKDEPEQQVDDKGKLTEMSKLFIEDKANMPEFLDLVNSLTVIGSPENLAWIAYISELSEWLEFDGNAETMPKAPGLKPTVDSSPLATPTSLADKLLSTDGSSTLHPTPSNDSIGEADRGHLSARVVCAEVVEAYRTVVVPHREAFPISELDDGPIKDVMTYLTMLPKEKDARPPEYTSAIFLWYDLQELWESQGYKRGKLPMTERPQLIHQWCKKGRVRGFEPVRGAESDPEYLRRQFWVWWSAANPEWRRHEGIYVLPRIDGDLSMLHQPGKDGLVLFLVILRWWYDLADGIDSDGMWTEGVKSVTCAMEALISELSLNSGGGVKTTGNGEEGSKKRKRGSGRSIHERQSASKRRKA
ncbi:hypothetical protein VNI00_016858 [Paramarasmius palmivorus]|uniref:Uncharacterized protein n=1 Tax=Paramarasmius palmivorus TaxID=297713 RepID=A0AAW0BC95_9AGAR